MPKKFVKGTIMKPRVRKQQDISRIKVVKVLQAAMENQSQSIAEEKPPKELESEFYTTGRIGRRNALPDILAEHCTTSTADLPDNFSALSTQDKNTTETNSSAQPGTSETNSAAESSSSKT